MYITPNKYIKKKNILKKDINKYVTDITFLTCLFFINFSVYQEILF